MSSPNVNTQVPPRFLPLVVLLFVGSGCAALVYEVVWFQMVSLIIGSSAISMGVILATFMGGMCLGSLLLAKYVRIREHPLRVYALLEAGIGVLGIVVLVGLPWVGGLYTAIGGPGMGGLFLRALFCALFLLPPTLLMGATLPAISRWVEATPEGVSWMGFFYGGNIAGAVAGTLLAGFYLLRVHDMTTATFVAVGFNIAVAVAGFALARVTPHTPTEEVVQPEAQRLPAGSMPVLIAIGISGMTALAAEVIWTRILSLMFGATVYTFSVILASFLVGLGIGSSAGSFMARHVKDPREALGWCQLFVMAGLAWAAYMLTQAMPYWPVNPELSIRPLFTFQIDLFRSLLAALPATILWGASFPLAIAAIARREKDPGRLVGVVYAANTVGAIVGAILASIILIAAIGTQNGQRLMIAFAAIAALIVLAPAAIEHGKLTFSKRSAVWVVVTLGFGAWFASTVAPVPPLLIAYGRFMAPRQWDHGEIIFWGEGMNSSMAVSELDSRDANGRPIRNYHNAGKVQASSEPQDMRLQRMLGHITTLLPETPGNILVIGCGAGVTAGAVSIDPGVQRLTIAEIEPLVPKFVAEHFGEHNFNVVRNPKTHIQIDDGRHFLLTTDETFDAITSDPFDPWVKGAATLYTEEFFNLAKSKLNDGGVMTVFVQLYESSMATVKSEIATFMKAFPNGVVFANTSFGQGYDVVLMGQKQPGPIDLDRIAARLSQPEYGPVAQSLYEIGIYSVEELFGTFAGDGPQLRPWLADAQINRDRNLRLQYLAGLGLNIYEADDIYRDMIVHRSWPQDLFVGSPERLAAIRDQIAGY